MKLTERSVSDLLAAFRSSQPTPGGGSAAALAGAVGASLLAMVAGLPKSTTANDEEARRLAEAGARCAELAVKLEALIDQDSDAYELVLGAFRMPKGTDQEKAARTGGIQKALVAATETPLEILRRSAQALATGPVIAELGNPNASSDARVAFELLGAAVRGAQANVETNLGGLKDADYVARVRQEASTLVHSTERARRDR